MRLSTAWVSSGSIVKRVPSSATQTALPRPTAPVPAASAADVAPPPEIVSPGRSGTSPQVSASPRFVPVQRLT